MISRIFIKPLNKEFLFQLTQKLRLMDEIIYLLSNQNVNNHLQISIKIDEFALRSAEGRYLCKDGSESQTAAALQLQGSFFA